MDKEKYPDVFVVNDELTDVDIKLFEEVLSSSLSTNERIFFEQMRKKESGEFAPSADILFDEYDNADELYFIRYYYDEYKIGRGIPERRCSEAIYNDSLDATLRSDLYPLLGRHVSFWEWLRDRDFKGINYYGNSLFNHQKAKENG